MRTPKRGEDGIEWDGSGWILRVAREWAGTCNANDENATRCLLAGWVKWCFRSQLFGDADGCVSLDDLTHTFAKRKATNAEHRLRWTG